LNPVMNFDIFGAFEYITLTTSLHKGYLSGTPLLYNEASRECYMWPSHVLTVCLRFRI